MQPSTGRPLIPHRPWKTARQEASSIVWLIAFVTLLQFELNAIENVPEAWHMFWIWGLAGIAVALATIRIERYFLRRGRLG